MKQNSFIAAACAAAFLITSPLGVRAESDAQPGKLVDAARLDGQQVNNLQGQKLGEIKQVLLDPKSGQARYAVLQVDKEWSLNNPEIAVPFGAFRVSVNPNNNDVVVQLDATKEKLQKAPGHKVGEADRLFSPQESKPIYSYWMITWVDLPSSSEKTSGSTAGTSKTGTRGDATAGAKDTGSSNSGNLGTPPSSSTGSTAGAQGKGSVDKPASQTSVPPNQ